MIRSAMTIQFAPLLPETILWALAGLTVFFLLLSLLFYKRGAITRVVCAAAFLLVFLNPSLAVEKRESVPDVAVIVADRSPSQNNGARTARTDAALEYLKKALTGRSDLTLRIVEAPEPGNAVTRETRLFDALEQTLSDVPASRRAGVIFLTDGQIHDAPSNPERFKDFGPVHALLTGERNEKDRRLVVLEAPTYGIVGQEALIRYRIEDPGAPAAKQVAVTLRQDGQQPQIDLAPVNEDLSVNVTINHAGQNIFDLETEAMDGEITQANNRAAMIVNGVRDRLRVLLVSGQPHAGGRTWRDMLTADPGVDLVHFTILREPDKLDATPQNELSLIAFPVHELFETKLYDFDLIIFDRYRLNRILPNNYFSNITRYVEEGGALLEASGPSYGGDESIYTTDLKKVLPALPTGHIFDQPFKPQLTSAGLRHPVTQNLSWPGGTPQNPGWGPWLRQVGVVATAGDTLMDGIEKQPLLILNHVGKGRVAQLTSDEIWLWSRGYEGGGPHAELLRRMAHWLMKEPELEENALDVRVDGQTITIRRRTLTEDKMTVTVSAPDGAVTKDIELSVHDSGVLEGQTTATQLGIYTIDDGTQQRFAIVGDLNPPELQGVRTTPDILAPLTAESGGSVQWLSDTPEPDVKLMPSGRSYGGHGWIGLRESRSFNVTGVENKPFLPAWIYALSLMALVIAAWWLEGRRGKTPRQAA